MHHEIDCPFSFFILHFLQIETSLRVAEQPAFEDASASDTVAADGEDEPVPVKSALSNIRAERSEQGLVPRHSLARDRNKGIKIK